MKNTIKSAYKMKKTLFIIIIAAFLLSCSGDYDDVTYTVTNKSSKEVSFSFNGVSENLSPNAEPITYTINSAQGRFSPKNPTFSGHEKSVILTTENKGTAGIFYTFENNELLDLCVENTLPIKIKLISDFINESDFTITIEEYTKNVKTEEMYKTYTPNFTVHDKDDNDLTIPITIEWKLEDNTINVVIK